MPSPDQVPLQGHPVPLLLAMPRVLGKFPAQTVLPRGSTNTTTHHEHQCTNTDPLLFTSNFHTLVLPSFLLINSIRSPDTYQNAIHVAYLQVWVLRERFLTRHLPAVPPVPALSCLALVAKPGFETRDGARGKTPLWAPGWAEEQKKKKEKREKKKRKKMQKCTCF